MKNKTLLTILVRLFKKEEWNAEKKLFVQKNDVKLVLKK